MGYLCYNRYVFQNSPQIRLSLFEHSLHVPQYGMLLMEIPAEYRYGRVEYTRNSTNKCL